MGMAVDWYVDSHSKMRVFRKLLHSYKIPRPKAEIHKRCALSSPCELSRADVARGRARTRSTLNRMMRVSSSCQILSA